MAKDKTKCKCVDALHAKQHKKGCTSNVEFGVILRRVKSTYNNPIPMCLECAYFALTFCDAQIVQFLLDE